MTRWRLAVLAALATVALTGCLRFGADLEVSQDDTVSGTYVVAVKEGTGDTYGVSDKELATSIWEDYPQSGVLADATIGGYHQDGYEGIKVTFTDAPLAMFAPTAEEWGIAHVGDEFVVSGPANSTVPDDAAADDAAGDADALADAEFTVKLTFPGKVSASNGTVAGRSVSWDLAGGPDTLEARASAVPTKDPAVAMSYVVAVVLGVGGLAYWLAGRLARRQR